MQHGPPAPVPADFDYDMWLGPASQMDYRPALLPLNWRHNFNFSGGMITDFGAHHIDIAQWAMDRENTGPVELKNIKGEMPATSADHHGMAYDSKRDRLLLFSDVGKNKGDVLAYEFKAGTTKWLNAAGREKALEHCRETIYLPEQDAVLIVDLSFRSSAGNNRFAAWPILCSSSDRRGNLPNASRVDRSLSISAAVWSSQLVSRAQQGPAAQLCRV